jgi:single-strand DNA-binding protein
MDQRAKNSLKKQHVMEITGRIVADAEVRTTKTDKKVTGFTIAINDSYRPKNGERVQMTTYIECAYWLNAGLAEYLKKGTLVELFGRIGAGAYISRDGEAVGTLKFHTERIKLLGGSGSTRTERIDSKATNKTTVPAGSAGNDDDLPF